MSITLTPTGNAGNQVSDAMFGGNTLFHINKMGDGFDQTMKDFGLSTIRWPGGSISEHFFDPANPDTPLKVSRDPNGSMKIKDGTMTFSETMAWAEKNDVGVGLVLPTRHLFENGQLNQKGIQEIRTFLTEAMSEGGKYADARIDTIEIGNEYWGTQLSASQYGKIANALVNVINDVISKVNPDFDPKILVQEGTSYGVDYDAGGKYASSGLSWGDKIRTSNADIINELSPDARAAIDGVVSHFYYIDRGENNGIYTSGPWGIQLMQSIWQKAGINAELHFTEWNVRGGDGVHADKPLFAAGGLMIEQFEVMMRMNTGSAFVWPVNQSTTNDLAGRNNDDPGKLSINGAAFKLLSENVRDMRLRDLNIEKDERIESSFYTGDKAAVLFLSESKGGVMRDTLNLSALIPTKPAGAAQLVITQYEINRDASMDPFVGKGSGAQIVKTFSGTQADISKVLVDLGAYEVAMIRFEWVIPEPIRNGGLNTVIGTEYDDVIISAKTGQTIDGRGGDDRITGSAGNDKLMGGKGNDTLNGGNGHDTISGDDGNDLIDGGVGNDVIYGNLGNDSLRGGDGNDKIWGGEGNDTVSGGVGNDLIYGNHGNDSLRGDAGNDTLHGEIGNDSLFGDDGNDHLNGGAGNDLIRGGTGNDTLNGEDGNDTLYGDNGHDVLNGGTGHDKLDGGEGRDTLDGGDGNDWLSGGIGNDTLIGGNGNDTLNGDDGHDVAYGGQGNDQIHGGSGNDALYGDDGHDSIWGGAEHDKIWGGSGNDLLDGGTGNDALYGGGGNDRLYGGDGHDQLFGGIAHDRIEGGAGNDMIVAGHGNDTLYGGDGNDTFYFGTDSHAEGGSGTDHVWGGAGADVFVFNGSSGWTGIQDFENGRDKIQFTDPDVNRMSDLKITSHDGGKNVLIEYDGGKIRLENFSLSDIGSDDFLF